MVGGSLVHPNNKTLIRSTEAIIDQNQAPYKLENGAGLYKFKGLKSFWYTHDLTLLYSGQHGKVDRKEVLQAYKD